MAGHNWKPILDAIAQLLDAIEQFDPIIPPAPLAQLRKALPKANDPTARDWAGFFAALAQFASVILPLILPLFQPKPAA